MRNLLLVLLVLPVESAFAEAKVAPMKPIKMLCGATDDNAKSFVVIDFETSQPSKDLGRVGETLPKTYSTADYPFPNYRPISNGKERFRVASQVMTNPYHRGQYIAYLTIFEEDQDGKTLHRRASHVVDTKDLSVPYQVKYQVPGTKRTVDCYAHAAILKGRR